MVSRANLHMRNTRELFALNVRAALKQHGWTQNKLSELCGIDAPSLSRYLICKTEPGIDVMGPIAAALGISVADLFREDAPPVNPLLIEARRYTESLEAVEARLAAMRLPRVYSGIVLSTPTDPLTERLVVAFTALKDQETRLDLLEYAEGLAAEASDASSGSEKAE